MHQHITVVNDLFSNKAYETKHEKMPILESKKKFKFIAMATWEGNP